jgi:hypothetical protein
MNVSRGQRSHDPVVPPEDASAGSALARSADVIRGLASDLVEERRRSKQLERDVRQLKAELAAERSRPS